MSTHSIPFVQFPTTAQIVEERIARHEMDSLSQNRMLSHRIISIPNGQHYGKDGHIPCDHSVEFMDIRGNVEVYDGKKWIRNLK